MELPDEKYTTNHLENGHVQLMGQCGDLLAQADLAICQARKAGANRVSLIKPPNTNRDPGWHKIVPNDERREIVEAEGAILSELGHALIIPSRDCPVLVLENLKNGWLGATHAGRDSLMTRSNPCYSSGVVEKLLPMMDKVTPMGKDLRAIVVGGICSQHFEHDDPVYVKPFLEKFGTAVVPNSKRNTLDLFLVIKAILMRYGVKPRNIHHDSHCTYTTPWLGSKRAEGHGKPNKGMANWTLVVKY